MIVNLLGVLASGTGSERAADGGGTPDFNNRPGVVRVCYIYIYNIYICFVEPASQRPLTKIVSWNFLFEILSTLVVLSERPLNFWSLDYQGRYTHVFIYIYIFI